MNGEAKCNCQHCDGTIEFPLEMAGQTVTCPHCQTDTLLINPLAATALAFDPPPKIEDLRLFKLFDSYLYKELKLGDANYILYLTPGDVRYLQVLHFIEYEVDKWIAYFKQMSLTPEISGPYGRESEGLEAVIVSEFIQEPTWEDEFIILHSFAVLHRDYGVPYTLYKYFHTLLNGIC
jgi:hypothetical protein